MFWFTTSTIFNVVEQQLIGPDNDCKPIIPQTFSDFVPGAKAHPTANSADEDKENTYGLMTAEEAAADAQVLTRA